MATTRFRNHSDAKSLDSLSVAGVGFKEPGLRLPTQRATSLASFETPFRVTVTGAPLSLRNSALLAGRKLLLADDSITIQKVVALTFADEGVEVVTVSDGQEALDRLEGVLPDIVLADVFMPGINGYQVCDYIKQNAQLKHIPVMLLVGSFEPFDEAEARRVGADDILTKPFQSIRRLIDKVGGLVGGKSAEDQVVTAELPPVDQKPPEVEKLSTEELAITTADTKPLPLAELPADLIHTNVADSGPTRATSQTVDEAEDKREMDTPSMEMKRETALDDDDDAALLDLGDIGSTPDISLDDFVLDLDLEEPVPAQAAVDSDSGQGFVEPQLSQAGTLGWDAKADGSMAAPAGVASVEAQNEGQDFAHSNASLDERFADTQEWMRQHPAATNQFSREAIDSSTSRLERVFDEPVASASGGGEAGQVDLNRLPPEVIDAIARRAVEQLSERVIQEIAWEVVPQLAELMIRRKLEDEASLK